MIESKMKEINIFFCTGSPKSGTTFLQMILNSHPEIACPSEHKLDFFILNIKKLLEIYNQNLKLWDELTGNQGPAYFEKDDYKKILKYVVEIAAYRGAKGRIVKWYGLNDNGIIINNHFELYTEIFPNCKFIAIVRDPRSVAVSSWYHNIRTEPGFLERRGKNKEHWCKQVAEFWYRENKGLIEFFKKHSSDVLILKYEDLKLFPFENYKKIFDFLKVNTDDELINKIIEKTSFKKFKDGKFFRKASIDEWKKELPPSGIKIIETKCAELMKYFKYEFFIYKHL